MEISNLIRMANRIGQFFEAMPDRQEAGEGVANHIHKFWEPRMRTQLLDSWPASRTAKPDRKRCIRWCAKRCCKTATA